MSNRGSLGIDPGSRRSARLSSRDTVSKGRSASPKNAGHDCSKSDSKNKSGTAKRRTERTADEEVQNDAGSESRASKKSRNKTAEAMPGEDVPRDVRQRLHKQPKDDIQDRLPSDRGTIRL